MEACARNICFVSLYLTPIMLLTPRSVNGLCTEITFPKGLNIDVKAVEAKQNCETSEMEYGLYGIIQKENCIGSRASIKAWGHRHSTEIQGWDSYHLRISSSWRASRGATAEFHLLHSNLRPSHLIYHPVFCYGPKPASKCGAVLQLPATLMSLNCFW